MHAASRFADVSVRLLGLRVEDKSVMKLIKGGNWDGWLARLRARRLTIAAQFIYRKEAAARHRLATCGSRASKHLDAMARHPMVSACDGAGEAWARSELNASLCRAAEPRARKKAIPG